MPPKDRDTRIVKVLSIEDDEFMRIFLRDIFCVHGDDGYEFRAVGSIEKAEAIVRDPSERPNLILLDIMLPEKEGGRPGMEASFRFLKDLKQDPELSKIHVIMFSAFDERSVVKQAIQLGADAYLVKGDHLPKELFAAVESSLKDVHKK